jgi:hypothetical protein
MVGGGSSGSDSGSGWVAVVGWQGEKNERDW